MPQLKMRGIQTEKVCVISKAMVDELQALLQCPREYFMVECMNSTFIVDGEIAEGYPIVEIAWFDRGQEIQDQVATIVTKYIHEVGYKNIDVIFTVLEEKKYYENGVHF